MLFSLVLLVHILSECLVESVKLSACLVLLLQHATQALVVRSHALFDGCLVSTGIVYLVEVGAHLRHEVGKERVVSLGLNSAVSQLVGILILGFIV